MKILLVGGGSGGPVSPLLAVASEIKKIHPKTKFLMVGTKTGPESQMARKAGVSFVFVSAGKFRRYFSFKNFTSPFFVCKGFWEAYKILKWFKPDCVFGTGSFVQVPVVWAAWFLKIPVVLHQQDIVPSLANRLCQVVAAKITVTFEINLKSFASNAGIFYGKAQDKVILTGNPFREEFALGNKASAVKYFNLKTDLPTLLVLGGGTGADFINKLVLETLPELSKTVQIIHSTGVGKLSSLENSRNILSRAFKKIGNHSDSNYISGSLVRSNSGNYENYHPCEFIENMADAYAAADVVLSRAGLSTITELSNLKKVSIIVPMLNSHQEMNALYLDECHAAIVLSQNQIKPKGFVMFMRKMLFEHQGQQILKQKISKIMLHDAGKKISEIILKIAEK